MTCFHADFSDDVIINLNERFRLKLVYCQLRGLPSCKTRLIHDFLHQENVCTRQEYDRYFPFVGTFEVLILPLYLGIFVLNFTWISVFFIIFYFTFHKCMKVDKTYHVTFFNEIRNL